MADSPGEKEQATIPKWILELIDRYQYQRAVYLKEQKKEFELRKEFIDPFFKTLGWDVDNDLGTIDRLKDVIHEESITIRGQTKSIDYSFRVGGNRVFIVETKKPSINLFENSRAANEAALQLRRYAWNAGLKIGILTNFEQFAVYDCSIRPLVNDIFSTGRIMDFTYLDYPTKWHEIVQVFAKKSVYTGSFDKYVESKKGKHGTTTVNEEFLKDIEEWRKQLAQNIAIRNQELTKEEINISVQKIIDRIIFLRICEDRGIEKYEMLRQLIEVDNVYEKLCEIFKVADDRYNSGLFHFYNDDVLAEPTDTLTLGLKIDDKVLKAIIKHLYFPDSPYEFSVIPTVILGQVYEQFLGKVIRLTEGHQVKIDLKEEVKKAGGVYYTPQHIVEYIVKQTLGKLVQGKTPRDVAKLRILDPACGSGSFLIGAYQFLLDWHCEWYLENLIPIYNEKKSITDISVQALLPEPSTKIKKRRGADQIELPIYNTGYDKDIPLLQRRRSNWKLTTSEKKRILLNNIYGVDIDQQAVEVTKLSLLLKVLEDENEENISKQLKLFAERALPSLHQNIKCGNSLIGTDILTPQITQEDVLRLNPFDWKREFPDIMEGSGFDAVIGNPPWGAEFSTIDQEYIRKEFKVANGRNLDSYAIFIEAGLKKLRKGGLLSYITPDTFLRKDDHYTLRCHLLNEYSIGELIETGPVFSKVRDTWALVFLLLNQKPKPDLKISHKNISRFIVSAEDRLERFRSETWDNNSTVPQELWKKRPYCIFGYLASEKDQSIIAKIEKNKRLGELSDYFSISRGEEGSKFLLKEDPDGNFFILIPKDVGRYTINSGLRTTEKSLTSNKVAAFYQHPKIWAIRIQKMRWKQRLVCTLDERINSAGMKTLQVIVSTIDDIDNLKFLQGILSSKLMNYYLVNYLADDMNKAYLEKIPIPSINTPVPEDKVRYNRLVALVTQMLDLNTRLEETKLEHERTLLSRQVDVTDTSINALVYELYGMTKEEIKIIEENE